MVVSIGDLGGKFLLGGVYYNNRYLITKSSTSPSTDVYDCTGTSCSLSETVSGIFGFHMQVYNGELYHIGTGSDYTSNGKVYKGSTEILTGVPGAGVRATVYDDKLFVGFSGAGKSGGSAQIKSYDGTTWTDVKTFTGFHHFGDFELVGSKLFVAVVEEAANPEVWSYDGTDWTKEVSATELSKYGVKSELINGGGFLQVCNDKLYMNINTPTSYRAGPGYILEIDADTTGTPATPDGGTTTDSTAVEAVLSLTKLQGGGGVIIRNNNRSAENAVLLENLNLGFSISAGYVDDGTGDDTGGGTTGTVEGADQIDCDSLTFLGTDANICDWEITDDLEVVVDSGLITMDQTLTDKLPTTFFDGHDMAANCWVAMEINGTWYTSTFEWMPEGTHSKEIKAVSGEYAKKSPEIPTSWLPTEGQELYFAVSGLARGGITPNAEERTPFVKYYWNSETPGSSLASLAEKAFADLNLAETVCPTLEDRVFNEFRWYPDEPDELDSLIVGVSRSIPGLEWVNTETSNNSDCTMTIDNEVQSYNENCEGLAGFRFDKRGMEYCGGGECEIMVECPSSNIELKYTLSSSNSVITKLEDGTIINETPSGTDVVIEQLCGNHHRSNHRSDHRTDDRSNNHNNNHHLRHISANRI